MSRAVFLDRDGVINRAIIRNGKPYPPQDVFELEILPGVESALVKLRNAGFCLIIVTNQPDVGRGTQTRENVEAIHSKLKERLPIDEIKVCYHDDAEKCGCRKPAPGMLIGAGEECELDLAESFMVGDRWRDIEAGIRAGCRTVFLDYGYDEKQPESQDACVGSLREAADWILEQPLRKGFGSCEPK